MGCCLSAGNHNQEMDNRRSINGEPQPPVSPHRILQVETVKEVLLEATVAPKPRPEKFKPMLQEWKTEVRKPPRIAGKDGCENTECGKSLSTVAAIKRSAAIVDQRPPLRKQRANGEGRAAARRSVAVPQPEKRGQVALMRRVRGEEVAPPRKECDRKSPAAGEAETLENPFVSLECFIFL